MDFIIILTDIILLIIVLILRALYTNWLTLKLKWESSFRRAFLANLVWIIFIVIISLLVIFIAPPLFIELSITEDDIASFYLIINLSIFIINIIIGIIIMYSFYKKKYWDSFFITIIVVISERILRYIIITSIYLILGVFLTEGFYLFTPF